MFIGRNGELQYLEQFYSKESSHIVVIYGQKNIGKTALASAFMEHKDGLYFLARSCQEGEMVSHFLKENGIINDTCRDFAGMFEALLPKMGTKTVLVIDEFHRIVKNSPSFMKDLIMFMNQHTEKQLLILLISSSISFVENGLISKIGEGALKISGFLKCRELSFACMSEYFKEYDMDQCIQLYSVLGGYPGFWNKVNKEKSVRENLFSLFFSEDAVLSKECADYMNRELRETGVYETLLCIIASGKDKLNDLHHITEYSRAKISVYLKNLMELELVEKVFSCECDGNENARKGIYEVAFPPIRFYFKYIYPNMSALIHPSKEYFKNTILADFRQYAGKAFEKMCVEHMQQMNKEGKLPFLVNRLEKWNGKEGTIDIVAKSDDGKVILGKCCYEKAMMTYEDYMSLLSCAKKAKLSADYIYLYSMERFDEKIILESKMKSNITLISMKKLGD